MRFYIFSNVKYPKENRIQPEPDDYLVFLNAATSANYYKDHARKFVYHRSPKEVYGKRIPCMKNYYLWDSDDAHTLRRDYITKIDSAYDWNYPGKPGERKSATTGYYVVEFLRRRYPDAEIVLVNFGFEVKNSTYRCEYHNWKFEAEKLKKYKHLFTEAK